MNKDLEVAKQTVKTEIIGLKKLYSSFNKNSNFTKAVNIIFKTKGKVLVVGTGKSFIIGNKISSSLSSLGTPSVAFSSSDLNHGSMGSIQKDQDVLLIFSVSGETSELNEILRYAKRNNIPVIGVSCKAASTLLKFSTIKILLPKVAEAGHSLAPTSTQINFLSWGDSLAIALMKRKKFTNKKFVSNHPSGSLATALIQVKEIMVTGNKIPIISSKKNIKEAVIEISKKKLGMVCVKKENKIILLTDGDLRRNSNNLYKKKIEQVATQNPLWVSETETALSAINTMNTLGITSLLVTNQSNINKKIKKLTGVLHLHAALERGIK